ncbi:reverse transcriptase [Gossypium australe]|uniref:Reverse transcriptase n=1 Tax=Gossypium australe TaxID=47621 RepID=A0A5B6U728_9ROSI|nr:reverse transcriptase [Gossypium australe]
MERDFARLSIDVEEDEVLQVPSDNNLEIEDQNLSLVGYFLTASIIHFPAMRSTMANLWHTIQQGENPMEIPLIYSLIWTQIHDIPMGFLFENLARQLGDFLGKFLEYDTSDLGKGKRNFMRVRAQLDVRQPFKRKKKVSFAGKCSYIRFKYERFTLFCFYYGRLGHNDSYCEAKMLVGVEVVSMGWDLSLRAQSKRALAMNSIWLCEEGEKVQNESGNSSQTVDSELWEGRTLSAKAAIIDPVLGFNFEGSQARSGQGWEDLAAAQIHTSMDHDLEDMVLIGEEGKKRQRGKPTDHNENLKLECPWFGEPTDYSEASAYAEGTKSPNGLLYGDKKGSKGGLCLAWKDKESVTLQSFSKSHIDVLVNDQTEEQQWRFTGFYGSPYPQEKEDSWNLLRRLRQQVDQPWLVCGDFNEIMYGFEKKGGLPREEKRMEAFRNVLEDCQLMDVGYTGNWFTWERGNLPKTNILERLDRGVANVNWMSMFPQAIIQHLLMEETFEPKVKSIWEMASGDLFQKLEYLKVELGKWASQIGLLRNRKKKYLTSKMAILMEAERTDDNLAELMDTKLQLNFELIRMSATQKRRHNIIHKLQGPDGRETEDQQEMGGIAQTYFQRLFQAEELGQFEHILTGVDRCISEEDNGHLVMPFTKEEILEALSGIGATKALGEDGLLAIFFQKLWHIFGNEVSSFCLQQLNRDMKVSRLNTTHIVLIPKKVHPTNLTHFRPISLCNVIYKIMAKAIANRFRGVLEKCIDKAQSAFVPGRLISDNALIAYEILNTLKKKRLGRKGLMAVKLDMSKAYDRVEWSFLKEMMVKMGFDLRWVNLIMKCISTVSYAIVLNRHIGNIFYPSRGLRQGDPLSPFLFLICGEGLSSLMLLAQREENFRGVKASRRGPQISHFSNTTTADKDLVTRILGVRYSNDPERYLGLPNMVGRKKKEAFQVLKDRFRQRIENWSIRHLSQWGKEIFIKEILQAIPTYNMACFLLPKTLCSELESIIARFWWQKGHGQRGIHWCTWKELCKSKENGGLGFRSLDQFNIALLAKQGWCLINYPDSLLAQRSIWATKKTLKEGLCWRIGNGEQVSIWNDCWIPGVNVNEIENRANNSELESVSNLIDSTKRSWKRNLIESTFPEHIVQKILQIPLAEVEHADFQVWRGEHFGELLVRSAYQLLQNVPMDPNELLLQAESKNFYRKLWNLQLPSKVCITIWRFTWNFIPTLRNLRTRRVVSESVCPRCRTVEEDSNHVLRNRFIHEGKIISAEDLSQRIMNYITELDRSTERTHTFDRVSHQRQARQETKATIFFDAAFDSKNFKSASGLVVQGETNEWLVSKSVIHSAVSSPFMAEAQAGLQATKLGISMGFQTITIVGDSKIVIKKCNSAIIDKSVIGAVISDIQRSRRCFQESHYRFVNRIENREAHHLAVEALRTGRGTYLESDSFLRSQSEWEGNGRRGLLEEVQRN